MLVRRRKTTSTFLPLTLSPQRRALPRNHLDNWRRLWERACWHIGFAGFNLNNLQLDQILKNQSTSTSARSHRQQRPQITSGLDRQDHPPSSTSTSSAHARFNISNASRAISANQRFRRNYPRLEPRDAVSSLNSKSAQREKLLEQRRKPRSSTTRSFQSQLEQTEQQLRPTWKIKRGKAHQGTSLWKGK